MAALVLVPTAGAHEGETHDVLPPEAREKCDDVEFIDGLGTGCDVGDFIRLEPSRGTPLVLHDSVDRAIPQEVIAAIAPEDGSASVRPIADASSVYCEDDGQYRVRVVYAAPVGVPNVYATRVPGIIDATLKAATHVRNRTAELEPGLEHRLRVACDQSGALAVEHVRIDVSPATFLSITDGVRAAIAPHRNENLLIYYEGSPGVHRGMGSMGKFFGSDVAQVYVGGFGNWMVTLHEMLHNFGAVSNFAPHATAAFHCTDGFDLMCYNDGGPLANNYRSTVCPGTVEILDCNADDYFHPDPPSGSYLANAHNVAVGNPYLRPWRAGDVTPPGIAFHGNPAWTYRGALVPVDLYDAVGIDRLEMFLDGSGTPIRSTPHRPVLPPSLAEGVHDVRIRATDTSGNVSVLSGRVGLDYTAPTEASRIGSYWRARRDRVEERWVMPVDALSGIAKHEYCIRYQSSECSWKSHEIVEHGDGTASIDIASPVAFAATDKYFFCVQAFDRAGYASQWCEYRYVDTVAPSPPLSVGDGPTGDDDRFDYTTRDRNGKYTALFNFANADNQVTSVGCVSTQPPCGGHVLGSWSGFAARLGSVETMDVIERATYVACVHARDHAGNRSADTCSDGVRFDTAVRFRTERNDDWPIGVSDPRWTNDVLTINPLTIELPLDVTLRSSNTATTNDFSAWTEMRRGSDGTFRIDQPAAGTWCFQAQHARVLSQVRCATIATDDRRIRATNARRQTGAKGAMNGTLTRVGPRSVMLLDRRAATYVTIRIRRCSNCGTMVVRVAGAVALRASTRGRGWQEVRVPVNSLRAGASVSLRASRGDVLVDAVRFHTRHRSTTGGTGAL